MRDIVERFLEAFYTGDVAAARKAIAEDFTLAGPFAAANSADELFELGAGLLRIVRGHRVLRWVVEGDTVAAFYEIALQGRSGTGWLTTAGFFTVAGGRVSGGRLIYDRAAFDAIVA